MSTHHTHHTPTNGPGKEVALRWLAKQLRWERLLDELASHGHTRVVLDLRPTAKLDFDALVALVLARTRLKRDGGELLLRCPSTDVSRLLELTGLTDLLDVLDDCQSV